MQTPRISPPMAVAGLALIISLATAGYAADTIGSSDIINELILTEDIKNQEVTTDDLRDGGVIGIKLATNAVTSSNVLNNSLTSLDFKGADINRTISLTAGAVANGRCRDIGFSVPGAAVGEAVLISLRGAATAGLVFSGVRVSSPNIAVIKVCNLTGIASPAVSNLPVRILTFG